MRFENVSLVEKLKQQFGFKKFPEPAESDDLAERPGYSGRLGRSETAFGQNWLGAKKRRAQPRAFPMGQQPAN